MLFQPRCLLGYNNSHRCLVNYNNSIKVPARRPAFPEIHQRLRQWEGLGGRLVFLFGLIFDISTGQTNNEMQNLIFVTYTSLGGLGSGQPSYTSHQPSVQSSQVTLNYYNTPTHKDNDADNNDKKQ